MMPFLLFFLLFSSSVGAETTPKKRVLNPKTIPETFLKRFATPIVNYLAPIAIAQQKSGIESIECIYVINLERRPEKWKKTIQLFDERGLKINRVNAVDGWQLSLEDQEKLAGSYKARLNPGQIGCILSHISVLKDARQRGFKRIWVCEDDVNFVDDFRKLPALLDDLTQLDPDWDILYTDRDHNIKSYHIDLRPDQTGKSQEAYAKREMVNDEIMTSGLRYGTHSMIISKKGINKIYNYFTHVYLWSPLDMDIHYIEGIREYSCRHDIVTEIRTLIISDTKKSDLDS